MSPDGFPKTSVESAVGERAILCSHLFPKRFGEGCAGELAIVECAARERGAVEYAVGEVATLEGDINEKRTGEVATKELAVGEAAVRNLKLDEARFCSMEPAEFDGFERSAVGIAENAQGHIIERGGYARCGQLARR